jgi:CDP-2,3-bis-(O-geranylgeranyl)-sn-glycerol synthase
MLDFPDRLSVVRVLILLISANSAPWMLGRMLRERWNAPLDFGLTLRDGRRLLGSHKTWRGLVGGSLACAAAAALCGLGWPIGAEFGVLSLLGDMLSSALKRRLGLAPGREVPVIDQLPEALVPLIVFRRALGLDAVTILATTALFAVLDVLSTRARHRSPAQ